MALSDPIDLTMSIPDVEEVTAKLELSPSSKSKKKKASVLPTFLPPCRVCNGTASGYHYGANTCEACKAFFRRSIGHEDAIKACSSGGKCADNPNGKISCTDCRHKKCLSIGMAREGCKKGRYTYEKRTQDTKEIRRMQAEETVSKQFETQQCADTVAMLAYQFEQSFMPLYDFINNKEKVDIRIQEMLGELYAGQPLTRLLYSPGHSPNAEAQNWYETINSHLEHISIHPEEANASMARAHNMVFDAWAFQAEKIFHGLASFAKCLPGFADLLIDDKIILVKQGRVDSLNILKHKAFYQDIEAIAFYEKDTGDLFLLPLLFFRMQMGNDGDAITDTHFRHKCTYTDIEAAAYIERPTGDLFLFPVYMFRKLAGDEFADSMLRVNSRIQKLNLTLEDMAVLMGFVILMSDREGLQRTDQVERLQDKMLPVLQYCLQKNHPNEPNIIADTLLLLPLLRESSEINQRCLAHVRHRVRPEETPLLSEMIKV